MSCGNVDDTNAKFRHVEKKSQKKKKKKMRGRAAERRNKGDGRVIRDMNFLKRYKKRK
jgi:hypothetical protein